MSEETIRTFPEQIILEFLTRLPAKSATRFKLVSKRFNALISHPHFIRTYLSRAPKTWFLLDRHVDPTRSELVPPPRLSSLSVPFTNSEGAVILRASKGFVLIAIEDDFFVINPVTNEWVGLSHPVQPANRFAPRFETQVDEVTGEVQRSFVIPYLPVQEMFAREEDRNSSGFTCRVDEATGLVDRFLIVQYRQIVDSDFAMVQCYSSETGKWEKIQGIYMLNRHKWEGDGTFEFDGTLFWIDLSIGLIFLKDDINLLGTGKKYDKMLQFGFIKLPKECERADGTIQRKKGRFINVGGEAELGLGWIQFVQVGKKVVKLWRLSDYECGDWSLAYKVSFEAEFGGLVPTPLLFHPFEAHIVVCSIDGGLLFVNLRTEEVQKCGNYSGYMSIIPAVIPGWPSPLPKMNSEGAKERGNAYFKEKKYEEAIRWYTTSITRSPTAVAYANRAAAYLKLNKFLEAEKDCTDCLYLDELFLKAYWRRAVARKDLGKLGEALEDAEHGLKVDPHHAELMKLAGEIKSLLEQGIPVEDVEGSTVSSM